MRNQNGIFGRKVGFGKIQKDPLPDVDRGSEQIDEAEVLGEWYPALSKRLLPSLNSGFAVHTIVWAEVGDECGGQ